MFNRKYVIISFILITVVIFGMFYYLLQVERNHSFHLAPKERVKKEINPVVDTEVGTGWGLHENPVKAAEAAVEMALAGKKAHPPDFAIVFATSDANLNDILARLRELWGPKTKIYGGTSDSRAVMTDKGFVKAAPKPYEAAVAAGKKGVAVMTVSSNDIVFGVGSAEFCAYPTIQAAAKAAIFAALKSAGKSEATPPQVVLCTPTKGIEEEALEGIEAVVGKNTPILGGTAGGPHFGVMGEKQAFERGVSLAVIYTDLPVGWILEGGFEVGDPHSGVVTKAEGQAILEIDGRPALEAYDAWLGGKVTRLYAETGDTGAVRVLLNLHPIYRKFTSPQGQVYNIFSHPWPRDKAMQDQAIMTSTKFQAGERIYLSHGTWERLLNRIAALPGKANMSGGRGVNKRPVLAVSYLCAGVMGVMPEEAREKMPLLINFANQDAPFIATFTWGEQGQLSGVGNKHVNLSTSFLVIGPK